MLLLLSCFALDLFAPPSDGLTPSLSALPRPLRPAGRQVNNESFSRFACDTNAAQFTDDRPEPTPFDPAWVMQVRQLKRL